MTTVATIWVGPCSSISSTAYVMMENMPSWMICWMLTLLVVPVSTLSCCGGCGQQGGGDLAGCEACS